MRHVPDSVLAKLGTSSTDLANRMQTDAKGAIIDFMRAGKELPAAEQAAALNTYFGEQSVAAIAPLLSNLGNLEEQFYKVPRRILLFRIAGLCERDIRRS